MRFSPFAVLGIDAAWTERAPSGVALVEVNGESARAIAAAPSYASFRPGVAVDWAARAAGSLCDADSLLAAAKRLTDLHVRCVAVDMALATTPITGRRAADDEISRAFARQWCGTHSPSAQRPGRVSESLRRGFERRGFHLAVAGTRLSARALVEVHPHAALVRLLAEQRRLPYKLARLRQYHPDATREQRRERLLATWRRIADALEREVRGSRALLPMAELERLPLARFKGVEDALDGIVCAWIGAEVMRGLARAYGDATAAIWVPEERREPKPSS